MKRAQILKNRQAWIDYLIKPETLKGTKRLVDPSNKERRCCLGHACHVLVPNDFNESTNTYINQAHLLPYPVKYLLGMYSTSGSAQRQLLNYDKRNCTSLTSINDNTEATPQEIGQYLQTVINGGKDTPFRSIEYFEK